MTAAAKKALAAISLAAVTLVIWLPACQNDFLSIDDGQYVVDNPGVQAGVTRRSLAWALTTSTAGNWHPLTWISLQIDQELFGMEPGGFHFTNIVLHTGSTVLLFLFLLRTTGRLGPSVVVAAFFAVHPLRVESVAWIAERKDVLSTFFGMLALWLYAHYAARPGLLRYLLVALALTLSLLSKAMFVTLPCLLLLLDWWPLRRPEALRRLLLEKVPLALLVGGCCVLTVRAQRASGFTKSLNLVPLSARLLNAPLACIQYLLDLIYPWNLRLFYPQPFLRGSGPVALALGAALLVVLLTVGAFRLRRPYPYLLAGWLWYLGTLVPVLGLVQVGVQGRADRYTYFPSVGVLIALTWGGADLLARMPDRARSASVAAVAVLLLACMVLTEVQIRRWHDGVTLLEYTLACQGDDPVVQKELASTLRQAGRPEEAIVHYQAVLESWDRADVRLALADTLTSVGRDDEAAAQYAVVLQRQPQSAVAHAALGNALAKQGRHAEALVCFRKAVELAPDVPRYRFNLAQELRAQGADADADREAQQGLRLEREAAALRP